MQPRTALYALTLLLPACDDGDPPREEPTIAELSACDESDLDVLPFMGPAFDDKGALVAPLPQPHVVATTVGWHTPENSDALEAETLPPMMDLFTHDGFLGATFATSARCGSARTLSLWRDEAARMKFVFGAVHGKAIKTGLKFTMGWETTNWSGSDALPTWADARRRLEDTRQ